MEGALYLDLPEEDRDSWEDVPPPEHLLAHRGELVERVLPVPNALLQLGGDQGCRLGLVQLQASRETLLC